MIKTRQGVNPVNCGKWNACQVNAHRPQCWGVTIKWKIKNVSFDGNH